MALWHYLQGVDEEFSEIDSTTGSSTSMVSIDLSSNTSLNGWKHIENQHVPNISPLGVLENVKMCLELYDRLFGDTKIPIYWKVPRKKPWPEEAWGLQLGELVSSMLGHAAVSGNAPPSPERDGKVSTRRSNSLNSSSSALIEQSNDPKLSSVIPHPTSTKGSDPNHRPETWYELFYDLVFVAAALQLGRVIKYDHRPVGLIKSSILFLMLRSTWDHVTMYQNRFHMNDSTHMAYYLMQAMGAFVVALHLRIEGDAHNDNQFSWDREQHQHPISLMATLCRLITVLMYMRAFYFARPADRRYLLHVSVHTLLSAIVFACSMLTPTDDNSERLYLYIWALGIFVEKPLMYIFAMLFPSYMPPMVLQKNVGHLVARQGMFFMLILGEAVIQLVQAQGEYTFFSYVRAVLGFAIVFNVGNVYYEQQQREPEKHVLMRSHILGLLWIELQSLLSLCVLFFAVGIKLVYSTFEEKQEIRDEYLMCGFASLSLILIYSMSLMHRGFDYNFRGTGRRLSYHTIFFTISVAIGTIPVFAMSSTVSVVILHILTTFLVIQDIFTRALRIRVLASSKPLRQEQLSLAWTSAMDSSLASNAYSSHRKYFGGGRNDENMSPNSISMSKMDTKK